MIIAGIGHSTRFKDRSPAVLTGRAHPRHRESDTKISRGHVTEMGSRLLRWAVIEAVQRIPKDTTIGAVKEATISRRGKEARSSAKVAGRRTP